MPYVVSAAPAAQSRVVAFSAILSLSIAICLLAHSSARAADEDNWHVYVGDAVVDTVDGSLDQVKSAGQWVLLADRWTLDAKGAAPAKMVTRWRPVQHPLVRMVTGRACVRVAVVLAEVSPGRTEVRVTGGVATQADLEGGPVLSLARAAGQKECRGYVTELRTRLTDELTADGAASGSPKAATADKR